MQKFVIWAFGLLIGSFALGDLVGSCRGNACIWPWSWWRALAESDRAAWANAIATSVAVIVALAAPWITVWATKAGERAAAEQARLHLVVALSPLLHTVHRRIRSVRATIRSFIEKKSEPHRYQWITSMRIPETKELAEFQPKFLALKGAGLTLQMLTSTLLRLDDEIASFELPGRGQAQLMLDDSADERLEAIDRVLDGQERIAEMLANKLSVAAEKHSLKYLNAEASLKPPPK